jgi:GNAT superfamily N-acetyltransferase
MLSSDMAIAVGQVRDPAELEQILHLQQANLAVTVGEAVSESQGFVTAVHTLEVLEQMHALAPSIVAKDGPGVVGYALTMLLEARAFVPILEPMFQVFSSLTWRGRPLLSARFYVMGQTCVADGHRGQGVFDALYEGHKRHYGPRFELIVTEISTRNRRSLRAHERVGFTPLWRYRDSVDEWLIVGWDWQPRRPA